jgi:class 3 adenylate cyclase
VSGVLTRAKVADVESAELTDNGVDEMLALAERLRRQNGGSLDESAIQAVAEATGAPIDYVRLAVKLRVERKKRNFASAVRANFLTLEPDTRRYVSSGLIGTLAAFFTALEARVSQFTQFFNDSSYGVFSMLGLVAFMFGLYNLAVARENRVAAVSGAILAGGFFVTRSLFSFLMFVPMNVESITLVPVTIGGAVAGIFLNRIFSLNRKKLGLRDPVQDRQELLAQLHALREQLHSGEQSMAFLSVDVVGSTRLKQNADPLAVEFTFNEYHDFVERIAKKHGGRVHSTAGDGVTCAFDHSQSAFAAAKNMQAELIELNLHRNKLAVPLAIRCGIHSGNVLAPDATDVTSLNFATVIDIAAHAQKHAVPGGIAVTMSAAEEMSSDLESIGPVLEIEGTRVAVWQPRKAIVTPDLTVRNSVPNAG